MTRLSYRDFFFSFLLGAWVMAVCGLNFAHDGSFLLGAVSLTMSAGSAALSVISLLRWKERP